MTGNQTRKKWTKAFAKALTAAMLLAGLPVNASANAGNQAAQIAEPEIHAEAAQSSEQPVQASAADSGYLGINPGSQVPESFTNDLWVPYDFKEMEIGDTAKLNPRRVEEGVANSIANDVQMPDFHYEIIRGDAITLEDMDQPPTQACANVTAVKEGTAVVQITYAPFTHTAGEDFAGSDAVNTAYVIYSVGGSKDIAIQDNIIEKEADRTTPEDVIFRSYDTLYFAEGDTAPFTLYASAENAQSVSVKCNGLTVAQNGDGSYALPLENRSNIVEITATATDGATRSKFHVLDARKIKINVENKDKPGRKLMAGDTAVVSFTGVTMPVYKLARIYNPRMDKEAAYVHYNCEETKYIGQCKQWNLAEQNSFEVPLTRSGAYDFHSGGIYCGWWGSALGADKTADNPDTPNLNAPVLEDEFSFMPDFSFTVDEAEGDVTFSIERFVIGQGFFVEPTAVHFNPGETVANLVERYFKEHNIPYECDRTYGFYLTGIAGADLGADRVSVPAYISQYLGGPTTESAKAYGNDNSPFLGEKSYGESSGWTYMVNNLKPDVGMTDYKLKDGDVVRVPFTLTWGQDADGLLFGSDEPVVHIPDKDGILKALSAFGAREEKEELLADGNVKAAYQTLTELACGIEGTDEQIAAAIQTLNQTAADGTELAQYKKEKRKELDNYKDISAYPQAQQKQVKDAILAGSKAILEATDQAAVDLALKNAKTAVDNIQISAAVTSITLNKTKLTLHAGASAQLKTTLAPENASDKSISWKSSDDKIAKVDNNGKVTALKPGTASITAISNSGQKKAACSVTVTAPKLELNHASLKLQIGKSTAAVKIKSSTLRGEKIRQAKSSRPGVVSVKVKKGVLTITGKKAGKSTVTVTSTNGGKAKVTIQVQKKVHVKSLTLNKQKIDLKKGQKFTLKAAKKPITATDRIAWTSSNPKVASVNAKGVVKALKKGKATITATSSNGKKAACRITVK